jgi:hypothetical protein
MTFVADPFWAKLPALAFLTTLYEEPVFAKPFPIRFRQAIGLGDWDRKPLGQIIWM